MNPQELRKLPRRNRRTRILVGALSLVIAGAGFSAPAKANIANQLPTAASSTTLISQLIVTYKDGVGQLDSQGRPTGDENVTQTNLSPGKSIGNSTYTVKLPTAVSVADANQFAHSLEQSPLVKQASPDLPVSLFGNTVSQDLSSSPDMWGLDRVDQQSLPLDNSYSYDSTGKDIPVYVLDSGIYSHSDFGTRISPGFTAFNDLIRTGDCLGHGTHVAGILGGTTFGVAKEVKLIPVRVFQCIDSTSESNIIAGINWIISDHVSGPAVVNMSFGVLYSSPLDAANSALTLAVTNLLNDGVTVVAASGNSNSDACSESPASIPGVLTVNSLNKFDQRSSFSNFGSCTDIYAPGGEVSAVYQGILSAGISSPTSTALMAGTSMATPFVSGAVARLMEENPTFNRTQIIATLFANATPYRSGIAGDASRMLFTATLPLETAAAEANRLAELARIAAAKAAADKAAADKAAADKAAADLLAAQQAAAYAISVPGVAKSLNITKLSHRKLDIRVAAPVKSKIYIQRKFGSKWLTVKTYTATAHRVVALSRSGSYRVKIVIPLGTITTSACAFK